ncbi:ADP-ribosylation factor 3 [Biomphalaria pfeifferi]|uniref:ADP-ribosylation factor 3 n=1 Tax=Biomphalaria pfeifferi TaxID=112525 RepID=A0AAD8B2C8_BIOPF|nr:ADP-ribosylation factor 3 [Biomphalaria pfeifferi]
MGAYLSFRKEVRIIIQGLDAAGKTSLLYRLKLGEIVTTIPTIGFNVETVVWNGLQICAWDLGGRDKIRPLYRHYYCNTQGFIYVIDSNDRERLDDALQELVHQILMEDQVKDTVVMVLANKQDLPNAMTGQEIEDALRKKMSLCSQTVFVRPCSVTSGEGMHEAFDDFVNQIKLRQRGEYQSGIINIPPSPPVKEELSESQLYSTVKYLFKSPLSCFRYFSFQENKMKQSITEKDIDDKRLNNNSESGNQIQVST